ncbi:oligosaccharide repeat unit polymerase [Nocardia sp. JW2]|uniref:oligosaccharide repeat unit polymerase n=1 Tax=Nocardia sp. JW2 TaxID=3450738 RepID=UPI003F42C24E
MWTAVAMIVIVPALLIRVTPAPRESVWVWALSVTTAAGLRYALLIASGRRRLVEMSFWVFTYVFLGLAPLVQMRTEQVPETTKGADPTLNATAMTIVAVGIAAFLAGLVVVGRRDTADAAAPVAREVDRRRALLLGGAGLLSATYYIAAVGLPTLFSSRDDLVQAVAARWQEPIAAVMVAGAQMPVLVAFVALVKVYQRAPDRFVLGVLILDGIVLAVVLNPIANARYTAGTAALAVAALFGLFATPTRFRLVAVSAVAALVVLFPMLDLFRYSASGELKTAGPLDSLVSPDYDSFAQINNTALYVQREGSTYGQQAAGVVLFWVPRKLWADKPTDTGILLADFRGYTFKNLSAPLWGELYINGTWPALVLGMGALGALARRADARIDATLRRTRSPGVLACILPFYLIILLRGSLLQAMSSLLVILVCSVFVLDWRKERADAFVG